MKKISRLSLFLLIGCISPLVYAQKYEWMQNKSSAIGYDDIGYGVAVDGNGNSYITGALQPDSGSVYSMDIFIAKYNAAGTNLWTKRMGSAIGQEAGNAIALDAQGNIYITGYFGSDPVDFDPGTDTAIVSGPSCIFGSGNFFMAKYDNNGNYIWAYGAGHCYPSDGTCGTATYGTALSLDNSGNIYLTGAYSLTINFNLKGGLYELSNAGCGTDIFVAKYDNNANLAWAFGVGSPSASNHVEQGSAVVADASGNVYVTGFFTGTVDFDPAPLSAALLTANSGAIFFAKYNSNGNYLWAKTFESSGNNGSASAGYSLKLDASNNIYLSGYFTSNLYTSGQLDSIDFDPGAGTAYKTTLGGVYDAFVAKYNSNGAFIWADDIAATGTTLGYTQGLSLALDANRNVYLTGRHQGEFDFDPSPGLAIINAGAAESSYLAKYDKDGNYKWAYSLGDYGGGLSLGYGVTADADSNVFLCGAYGGDVDFGLGCPAVIREGTGGWDIFLAKYSQCCNTAIATTTPGTLLCVNDTVAVSFTKQGTFNAGNVFTAQLSNEYGSFKNPVNIGSLSSVSSGTVSIVIPQGTVFSGNYRIRVVGSNPPTFGCDNGQDITLNDLQTLYIDIDGDSYDNGSVTDCFGGIVPPGYSGFTAGPDCNDNDPSNSVPSQPGNITVTGGIAKVCPGETRTYTTPNATGVTWSWIVPPGATINSGQGSRTINVTYGASFTASGTLSVVKQNGCGSSIARSITVNRNNPAATLTTNGGPTTFCSGTNPLILIANAGAGLTYQWKKGSANITGATNQNYVPTTTSSSYKVVVTNTPGCSKTSAVVSVTVNPLPAATITPQGPTTFCAGGSVVLQANSGTGLTYQWKKGANLISGATQQNKTVTSAGTYKVIVTNTNSCSKTSAGTVVTVNCRLSDNEKIESGMEVFPNPTKGMVTLKFISKGNQNCELLLTDVTGREVMYKQMTFSEGTNELAFDMSNFVKGIYLIKLQTSGGIMIERIVKE